MNGKQAKRIRREAEAKTVGQYARNYEHVKGSRQIRLTPDCTRVLAKKLKREYLKSVRI